MKRVLIVAYYWPPSGGAGVQRWVKFVQYLRDFGWEPVVYTPSNPEVPIIDETLLKEVADDLEVLKYPIWEPYSFYKKFLGKKEGHAISPGVLTEVKEKSFKERLSVWVRGNFFIPDARKFWVKPSVNYLSDYLQKNPVDAIITTGPPHSMHLIGLGLQKKTGIKWVADFRDPWTNIHFYDELMLSTAADKKHRNLEKAVLSHADHVVSASMSMEADFRKDGYKQVTTITNGFDQQDYSKGDGTLDAGFSLTHIGTLYGSRNPQAVWQALQELVQNEPGFSEDFKLRLIGKTEPVVLDSIREYGLEEHLENLGYLAHEQVVAMQQKTQLLLLIFSQKERTIIPGKLFEYLAARRPVVCIGSPEWDAPQILAKARAGQTALFGDKEKVKSIILEYYHLYKKGQLTLPAYDITRFSRPALTERYAQLLDKLTA